MYGEFIVVVGNFIVGNNEFIRLLIILIWNLLKLVFNIRIAIKTFYLSEYNDVRLFAFSGLWERCLNKPIAFAYFIELF